MCVTLVKPAIKKRKKSVVASMASHIVLIGPYLAGKSTIAERLSRRLGWSVYSLDKEQERYLKERTDYEELQRNRTTWGLHSPEWQSYDAYVVERFLTEYSESAESCIFDFGAGHSVYEDEKILARVQQILAPHNVVLILPSRDQKNSLRILLDRTRKLGKCSSRSDQQINEFNRCFIQSRSNYALADLTIYTEGKSPKETCTETLAKLDLSS